MATAKEVLEAQKRLKDRGINLKNLPNKTDALNEEIESERMKKFKEKIKINQVDLLSVNPKKDIDFEKNLEIILDLEAFYFEVIQNILPENKKRRFKMERNKILRKYGLLIERYIPDKIKRKVWIRDNGKCIKCKSIINLHYHHIIPFSKGGASTIDNIQLLCEKCNRKMRDYIS